MIILSHRGYWQKGNEKNTPKAFERSVQFGYGLETDVRNYKNEIVVEHDLVKTKGLGFDKVLRLYEKQKLPAHNWIAINIKADGLGADLLKSLSKLKNVNYFCFDMSVPETIKYRRLGLQYFVRLSEYEVLNSLYQKAAGVWIDFFESEWLTQKQLQDLLKKKYVCLVSPELHGREHTAFWKKIKKWKLDSHPKLMICTDLPQDAERFFNEKN